MATNTKTLNWILRISPHWIQYHPVSIQVGDNRCLLQSLKDSPYYQSFQDKVRSKDLLIRFSNLYIIHFYFVIKSFSLWLLIY